MNTKGNEVVVPGLDHEDVGTLLNVRTYKQYCSMIHTILAGKCPFCELDRILNKVIFENQGWKAWLNPFPHKHQKYHFIMATNRHVTHIKDLTEKEWFDVFDITREICGQYQLTGGGFAIRFGDPNLNAGSIRHLHANIMIPDCTGRVQVTLAKEPEDVEEKTQVLIVFEKIRLLANGGEMPSQIIKSLTEDEWNLVKDRIV